MKKFSVLGVCAAQGAMLYSLRKHVVGNIEPRGVLHTPNDETWKLNFGEIPFVKRLEDLPLEIQSSKPDLIVGSPSCGHSSVFSYSRKKSLGKPQEDRSLTLFFNSVNYFKPKWFVMENLPKLIDLYPLEEMSKNLPDYDLQVHCHPVSIFGNSQVHRKRLILTGRRLDVSEQPFKIKPITALVRHYSFDRLCNQVRPELNFIDHDNRKVSMYHYSDKKKRSLTLKEVKNLWNTEFKGEDRWPMKGHKMNNLPGVYRLQGDKYPLTLRPSNRQFAPDGSQLGLEHFRVIMGFPQTFKVHVEEDKYHYWLQKARVAYTKGAVYEVGTWVCSSLKRAQIL